MTKQQFLAMSLPYGLKGIDGNGDVAELIAYDIRGYFATDIDIEQSEEAMNVLEGNFKIILHPLSDLTKEIEHKGEMFVPIEKLCNKFSVGKCSLYATTLDMNTYETYSINILAYFNIFQKLIEWHFDLFGGIDSGDAIDVNSLHENPYK